MSKNYTNIVAELYDCCLAFSKYRNDSNYALDFYLSLINNHQVKSVLELGSATGNLTIPIAETGIIIDSVDISEEMHKIIEKKLANKNIKLKNNLNLITADVFSIKLIKKYDIVIMPDNFLSAMSSYEEQSKLIELSKKFLKQSGLLVFDVSPPNKFLINKGKFNYVTRARTALKNLYIVKCEITTDSNKQLQYQNFDIDKLNDKMKVIENYKTQIIYRYLYKSEIMELLKIHGFEILEERDQITDKVKELTFVAKLI